MLIPHENTVGIDKYFLLDIPWFSKQKNSSFIC